MTAAQLAQEQADKVVAITKLATLLGGDISVVLPDYMSAVDDVPLVDLRAGIERAKKACPFFPRPAELREQCDLALRNRKPVVPVIAGEPDNSLVVAQYCCTRCEDTGWEEAPSKPGASYTVRRCVCFPTNSVLASQRIPTYGKKEQRRSF